MYSSTANIRALMADFHINGMMLRYSTFVRRLHNWCQSLGFESGKIMPSRAFCSDENQGYLRALGGFCPATRWPP